MTSPVTRESAHVARRDAGATPLRIIGERPWWLFDRQDFVGFTVAQIEASLTVPAVKEGK